jgi:glutathione S-transferase
MVVDGRPMFESAAMVIFFGETHGRAKQLWPEDDAGRADAMGWTVWGMAQLGHDIHGLVMSSNERVPKAMHNAAQAEAGRGAVAKDLSILDARLEKQPFVMGDGFTLADIVPASSIFFSRMAGIDLAPYGHVAAWMARLEKREALKRAQALMAP